MEDARSRPGAARGWEKGILGRIVGGRFRIDGHLGAGAMGLVYKAKWLALDKDVALKLMHGKDVPDATFVERFHEEARAASKLDHPNSVRVVDFGQEPDGLLYIAMEYLDGRDLQRVLREDWPLPAPRVADIVAQALGALAMAHDLGIVHRDLKPENIMILRGVDDEGRENDLVKVCDFGIAKFTEAEEGRTSGGRAERRSTTQGIVLGTPEYMSPEQSRGEPLDARSDLYSMGVILYQLLTGRLPFDADTALGVVLKQVTEEPVPPRVVSPECDARLEAICLAAMKKNRHERYATARDMRAELRAFLGAVDPTRRGPSTDPRRSAARLSDERAESRGRWNSGRISPARAMGSGGSHAPSPMVASTAPAPPRARWLWVGMIAAAASVVGGFVVWELRILPSSTLKVEASSAVVLAKPPASDLAPVAPPSVVAASVDSSNPSGKSSGRSAPARAVSAATAAAIPLAGASASLSHPLPRLSSAPLSGERAETAVASSSPLAASVATSSATVEARALVPPRATNPPGSRTLEESGPERERASPVPAEVSSAAVPDRGVPPSTRPADRFDSTRARVDWRVVGAGGGATPGAVQRALSRAAASWTRCYQSGLERRNERVEGGGTMHLTTDESGNVIGATVSGFDAMPAVKACVASAARVRIEGVDTGDAWADVELSFRAQ
jgi:serine/threonine-protein kinase